MCGGLSRRGLSYNNWLLMFIGINLMAPTVTLLDNKTSNNTKAISFLSLNYPTKHARALCSRITFLCTWRYDFRQFGYFNLFTVKIFEICNLVNVDTI